MSSASKILIKRTSVSSRTPSASSIDSGELALNLADGKIFFKGVSNNVITICNDDYYRNVITLVQANSASWSQGGNGNGGNDTFVSQNSASWLEPVKRFEYVESTNPVSYSGVAEHGSSESDLKWTIKKIFYTSTGSISATRTAQNVSWTNKLVANYS